MTWMKIKKSDILWKSLLNAARAKNGKKFVKIRATHMQEPVHLLMMDRDLSRFSCCWFGELGGKFGAFWICRHKLKVVWCISTSLPFEVGFAEYVAFNGVSSFWPRLIEAVVFRRWFVSPYKQILKEIDMILI